LGVGDGDHRIVEAGVHVGDAGGDVLALPSPEALRCLSHLNLRSSNSVAPVRSLQNFFAWAVATLLVRILSKPVLSEVEGGCLSLDASSRRITSSCPRSAGPCPCGCAR